MRKLIPLVMLTGCTGIPEPVVTGLVWAVAFATGFGVVICMAVRHARQTEFNTLRVYRIMWGSSKLAVLLLLASCSFPPDLVPPPGRGAAAARLDTVTCDYEAERAVPATTYTGASTMMGDVLAISMAQERITRLCKLSRGWKEVGR